MKPEATAKHDPPRTATGRWVKGHTGNPGGRTNRLLSVRRAIDEARDPIQVKQMLAALFERGVAGDNFASKLWLEHIVPLDDSKLPDLSDAPPEVLDYLERVLN
jgi:hypothetical protein